MLDIENKKVAPVILDFHEPTIEDAKWAVPILQKSGYAACEFSFTTIFMWRKYYNNQIAQYENYIFLRSGSSKLTSSNSSNSSHSSHPFYLLPVGGDLKGGIDILREYQNQQEEKLVLFGADEEMRARIEEWYPGEFEWKPSPNDFDYLYRAEDLATLPGKKYHSKRNHISSFTSQYNWSYEEINESNRDEVIQMTLEWCYERGNCSDPGLKNERCAIREALHHMDELSLRGGLLRVEGKVVAMTMGSPISETVYDIHVEKALPAYSGAYAVINKEFAAHELLGKYELINRENDLGIEGLRRAKKSYKPTLVLEKFMGTAK